MSRFPSFAWMILSLYNLDMKRSAARHGSWYNLNTLTWPVLCLIFLAIGLLCSIVVSIVSGIQMFSVAPSLAEYGAIFTGTHLKTSSSTLKMKAYLKMGQGTFLYYGIILLWIWPLAVSSAVSMLTPLLISMNVSKVVILVTWNICIAICSSGITCIAASVPGPRINVIRFIFVGYLSLLRCVVLLLFVKR